MAAAFGDGDDAQYLLEAPFKENVAIVLDRRKGRCLIAMRDFKPGNNTCNVPNSTATNSSTNIIQSTARSNYANYIRNLMKSNVNNSVSGSSTSYVKITNFKPFDAGDIVIQEDALCYARYANKVKATSAEELTFPMGNKDMYVDVHRSSNKNIISQLPNLLKELTKLPKVASLDTARCLLQLLGLTSSSPSSSSSTNTLSEFQLRMLNQLSAANMKECARDIKLFRKKHPKWLPKQMNDNQIAKLLGILNTNQMELDEIGGSGLFVVSAILEHNCNPNASFTTSNSTVYVAALKHIKMGDRISLDYTNDFYCSTEGRIESLNETYGFICDCKECSGSDRRRAFDCKVSNSITSSLFSF